MDPPTRVNTLQSVAMMILMQLLLGRKLKFYIQMVFGIEGAWLGDYNFETGNFILSSSLILLQFTFIRLSRSKVIHKITGNDEHSLRSCSPTLKSLFCGKRAIIMERFYATKLFGVKGSHYVSLHVSDNRGTFCCE